MLSVTNLAFAYNAGKPDAIPALRGVSFTVAPGELVAVLGQNGSGKSTLARLLAGILTPTSGSFSVDGVAATEEHLWEIRRRVGMVFQRPDDQLITNVVVDDVAFGPENLGLPRAEIEARVSESLAALGLEALRHKQISELSGGEKQRVAIAGVLAMRPSYLILDEPTTMLPPAMARQVVRLAHELRDHQGLAVLHITHFMHEVVGFDRLIVLDAGQIFMDGPPREVFARGDELRAIGLEVPRVTELGRRLRARGVELPETVLSPEELATALAGYGGRASERVGEEERLAGLEHNADVDSPPPRSAPLIEAIDLQFTYMEGTPLAQPALRGLSCAIYEGETVAILGGTQAGKSTLIDFFAGLRRPEPGQLRFAGTDVRDPTFDSEALARAVSIVFQQPETQLIEETVGKDVAFVPRRRGLAPAESRALVEQALTAVGLDYETFRLRYVYALSGGQKRRVAIAGALAAQPRVLILDEPVAGLDPRGRSELARLIGNLSRRDDLTVIIVGNSIDELAELADRAIVLHEGQATMAGPLRELLRRADELYAMGLDLSEPARIALALRPHFPTLPTAVLTLDELEHALAEQLGLPPPAEPWPSSSPATSPSAST